MNTYTVSAFAGSKCNINPFGTVSVNYGATQLFTITPDAGYLVAGVLVDGNPVGAVSSYTLNTVVSDHTIVASFAPNYTFIGFLPPIINPTIVNTGHAGRTYPVKWQLKDASGNFVTSLSAITKIQYGAVGFGAFSNLPGNLVETSAAGQTGLRYDSTANQLVYNWASPAAGCYVLIVMLTDGSVHQAYFNLSN